MDSYIYLVVWFFYLQTEHSYSRTSLWIGNNEILTVSSSWSFKLSFDGEQGHVPDHSGVRLHQVGVICLKRNNSLSSEPFLTDSEAPTSLLQSR